MILLEHLRDTLGKVDGHNLPGFAAALIGILFLLIALKAEKLFAKLGLLLVATSLMAAAYWWFNHIES